MDIKVFKNMLFEKAKQQGFLDCEIFYKTSESLEISVLKGDIEKFENEISGGVSFRGIYNGKMGYSYAEQISENVIDNLITYAKENAQIINDEEKEEIYEGDKDYKQVKSFYENIQNIDVDTLTKKALEIEQAILSYDKRIINCEHCVVAKSYGKLYISNTKGLELFREGNYLMFYATALAEENGVVKSEGKAKIVFDIDDIDTIKFGQKVAKKVLACLGATSLPSKKYNIVFENKTFSSLFSCFLGSFYAENVQKGFSLLKGKLNKKIASPLITILDEPLMEKGYRSTGFDAEGVACFNKTVVEDGVLKTYLYNLKSAKKDGVKSTGNAVKGGYKGKIGTSCSNFYIKNGQKPLTQLLEEVKDGVYITSLSGLHAGVNAISGDFSLLATGYLIENGKKTKPVEQITIAGNFYEVLNNIKDLADDLDFAISGIGCPSIFVGELNISGE